MKPTATGHPYANAASLPSSGPDAPSASRRPRTRHRGLVLMVMCAGMFLVLLDGMVVNVALPTIGPELRMDLSGLQWVVDGYTVPLAALLLAGGTLGDLYGHRRLVLAGLALFGLASAACGLAPTAAVLLTARALQGVGAALLLPGTLAVITHTFPDPREQARALGLWAGISSLALPAGPLLGGALVTLAGWRAVFLVNLPVVLVAGVATVHLAAGGREPHARRLDVGGVLTATLTLGSLVFAVIEVGRDGFSPMVVGAAVVAAAGMVAFVGFERRVPDPMLPLRLLRSRAFVAANTVAGAMNLVGFGTVFVTTLFLQVVQHRSALEAGVDMLPLFLPLAVLSPVAGRLTAAYGPRLSMTAGLLVGALGSVGLVRLVPESSFAAQLPALLGIGIGMGFLTASVVAAGIRAVPADRAGLAGAVTNAARQSAGALGIAIYGAVAGSPARPTNFTAGLHHLGLLAAGVWLVGVIITMCAVPREDDRAGVGVG